MSTPTQSRPPTSQQSSPPATQQNRPPPQPVISRSTTQTTNEARINVSSNIRTHELSQPILFAQSSVRQFRDSDFTINARELVCLNYDDCFLVLFYNSNDESLNLAKIWSDVAAQTPGFTFGAVQLEMEKQIAQNFARLNQDPNHPLHWAALQQTPFILVYRKGWPTAFYNGTRATQSIIDYTMTLACRADYHEHAQNTWSLQARTNIEMSGTNRYESQKNGGIRIPPRTTSEQFTVAEPYRGYDNSLQTRYVPPESIQKSSVNTTYGDIKAQTAPPKTGSVPASTKTPSNVPTSSSNVPTSSSNARPPTGNIPAPIPQQGGTNQR